MLNFGLVAYSSSGALITLTEVLAEEYKEIGLRCLQCLALGAVQTEMLEEAFPGFEAPLSAEEMATYIMEFALTGNVYFNGSIQVSSTTLSGYGRSVTQIPSSRLRLIQF